MKELHSSLKVSTNIILIIVWGSLSGILFMRGNPHSWRVLMSALILGIMGGIMQRFSFREAKASFLTAQTMPDVRSVLKTTKWGKRYIYFLWGSGVVLVVIAILWGYNPIIDIPMGYFALIGIREIITLQPIIELRQLALRPKSSL